MRTQQAAIGSQASGFQRARTGIFESSGFSLIAQPPWLEGGLGRTELQRVQKKNHPLS